MIFVILQKILNIFFREVHKLFFIAIEFTFFVKSNTIDFLEFHFQKMEDNSSRLFNKFSRGSRKAMLSLVIGAAGIGASGFLYFTYFKSNNITNDIDANRPESESKLKPMPDPFAEKLSEDITNEK